MERVSDELADCTVLDRSGATLRVGDTWSGQPGLLLFVRQWGCVACAMQAAELTPRLDLLQDLGVRTLLVGTGPLDALAHFVARSGLENKPITVATDLDRRAYRAAGMIRSAWGTWGPPAVAGFVRGTVAGHLNRIEGDPNQQGGAILVDETGAVRFLRRSAYLGDLVAGNDLVDTALRLAAAKADAP